MNFKRALLSALLILLPVITHADPQVIPQFRGLHNSENAVLINDDEAQDLQDVDITDTGKGIRKRAGYNQFKTIGTSTWGVRGGYYFRDTGGTDLIIHANNRSIFYSEAGGNYTAFVTTDTEGSYYDFVDSYGYIWRANSNRDEILRYDGTTVTYYPSHPKGDQIEALPDRLAISGTSANPNRVHFSKIADFTSFTTGTDEADAFTEDIGLPGQKVNAIKVACGSGVLAWTRDSTFLITAQSQYDLSPTVSVSNTIGTVQPSTIIQDYGITYWQGQDGHFYSYDCNAIKKLSEKLDVSEFVSGASRLWTATSQSDFETGTIGAGLSASASPGGLVFSPTVIDSFSDGDYTSTPAWQEFDVSQGAFSITGGELKFDSAATSAANGGLRLANSYGNVGAWEFDYRFDANGGYPVFKICSETPATITPSSSASDDCYAGQVIRGGVSEIFENDTSKANSTSPTQTAGVDYNFVLERGASNEIKLFIDDVLIVSANDASIVNISTISFGVAQILSATPNWFFDDIKFNHFVSTYQTTAISIGSLITSWGRLVAEEALDGATIAYAVYTDTNTSITITNSSTFVSSQTILNNEFITLPTAPYLTIAAFFTRTAHTQNPTIESISITWDEGSVIRHFGSVDSDHRLLWSVGEGNTSVTNKTYIYDPRFDSWLKYSFPIDAPAKVSDLIYFGGVSTGVVYTWPVGENDNGSAITAYWKSKDFIGGDPFVEKDFLNYSFLGKAETGSNLDIVYTINASSSVSNNHSLTDPNSLPLRRVNAHLPSGKVGSFINFKFGNDDANAPFEIYGFKYDYRLRPWRVLQ